MGFFGKIKQGLGIGTIKVQLQVPPQVAKSANLVEGQLSLNAESDQHVNSIKFRFVETYTTGKGEDKKTREIELGTLEMSQPFDIKKGESRSMPFSLPFQFVLSGTQALAEKDGIMGALGKAAVFAQAEMSEYSVKVVVDCAGAAFDPNDSKNVRVV